MTVSPATFSTFLQAPQQFRLTINGQFSNFVEEDRPLPGRRE
ncbi:MAG TPA: hypothetical protein VKU01_18190 [Bryobacteraceae bacterium]|nr:hypothetical protein [Bryobacteraceae bacterium]